MQLFLYQLLRRKKQHEIWSHKKKIKASRYCKHYKHIQLCHKKHRAPTILVCSRPTNNEKNNNGKNKNRYACTSVYYVTCISIIHRVDLKHRQNENNINICMLSSVSGKGISESHGILVKNNYLIS